MSVLYIHIYIYIYTYVYIYVHICMHISLSRSNLPDLRAGSGRAAAPVGTRECPEGTKRATPVNVQLLRLRKDLRTGSISRDIVNFPSELCRRRSGIRLVLPEVRPIHSVRDRLTILSVYCLSNVQRTC